jgi:hypothetical protein
MVSSGTKLIVVVVATVAVLAGVAMFCEDCGTLARQALRELARALR